MSEWREVFSHESLEAHARWLERRGTGVGRLHVVARNVDETRLKGAVLDYSVFERSSLVHSAIAYSNLNHVEMLGCDASRSIFIYSDARDSTLCESRFVGADFRRASLTGSKILHSDLSRATFVESHLVDTRVSDSSFHQAGLVDAQLDGARFIRCDFGDAGLGNAMALGTTFEDCDFRLADLEGLRLANTTFIGCKFAGATGKPRIDGPLRIEGADIDIEKLWRA